MTPTCDYQVIKMYTAENFFLRIAILLCMAVAVLTIIYFTPTPDQYFRSCDRPCHALDWPMICRVKLIIDLENRKFSQTCQPNSSLPCTDLPPDNSLFTALTGKITVNERFPGPAIQVCQNDVLVVDVVNKLEGNGISLHWRGQPQEEAPFMDGAPMVTQCPITSFTTFQYKFRASNPGTHLWQAFAHSEVLQGIYGGLIVRKADVFEEQRKYYDHDEKGHVLVISTNENKLLFNGKQYGETFNVTRSKRYRFRAAYTASRNCVTNLTVENHQLKVLSLDGRAIIPYEVSTIRLAEGERVDFVLKAKYLFSNYKMSLTSSCQELEPAEAMLQYNLDAKNDEKEAKQVVDVLDSGRMFSTEFCASKLGQVCLGDVQAMEKVPKELKEYAVDRQIYLTFDSKQVVVEKGGQSDENIFHMHGYSLYVMGSRTFDMSMTEQNIRDLDNKGMLLKRNLNSPVVKDTIRVPKFGVVALRFIADNPGFWMFRDEQSPFWTRGMDIVFHVGSSSNLVTTPTNFPTCGSWVGPEFFLL